MSKSKIRDDNYYQVAGWMINRLGLKGVALDVYAIIHGFSQDGESWFIGGLQYLCDFTGATKPTIIKALKELVEKGYLRKKESKINGIKFCEYQAVVSGGKETLPEVKEFNQVGKETLPEAVKEFNQVGKETLPNNKDNNKLSNNKEIIKDIVFYLNKRAGTNFRPTTESTKTHIIARLNEGFTFDDFKTVIDKKCAEWLGNEKMQQYLRPKTLFGTNFESYLNANTTVKTGRKEIVPNWIAKPNEKERLMGILEEMNGGKTVGNDKELADRAEALRQQFAR